MPAAHAARLLATSTGIYARAEREDSILRVNKCTLRTVLLHGMNLFTISLDKVSHTKNVCLAHRNAVTRC